MPKLKRTVEILNMKIIVKAKPNAREEKVVRVSQPTLGLAGGREQDIYEVSVKEPPINDKANVAIIRVLAKHFKVAPSLIQIVAGRRAKRKIFDIGL
ncbi:MAG: hypothetical protein COV96_02040 [Candidatus Zambryskibacteria bacterium CG11_big_fil_rev_8_21_14_0_20_42_18]|nr:MAG: hypothetical protein COV96_02040 [Candidatus Zambryskibacteria bacterium CG11_big_fil_rev_8_21_14_0_20_42_18]